MSKSSDAAPRRPRVAHASKSAGETVVVRSSEIERRTHTLRELARGDRGDRPRYRYRRIVWHWLFAAIDAIGGLVFGLARLLMIGGRSPAEDALDGVRSVLLIQLDHLGDGVLTCSVLPALRKRFPEARITALVSPSCLELFRNRPEIDEVLLCDRNRFSRDGRRAGWIGEVFRLGRSLRPRAFDVAIDFRGEFPHALLMWLAGARVRVGWDCGGGGFLLTHHVAYVPHRHEVLSRWAVVTPLGVARPRSIESFGPRYAARQAIPDAASRRARSRRSRRIESTARGNDGAAKVTPRVVVCHLGAGTSAKRWPVAHWKRFILGLASHAGVRVVLVGGEADRASAESIVAEFQSPAIEAADEAALGGDAFIATEPPSSDRVENRIGAGSLAALWDTVAEADLVIGADSGPAHIAAAAGRPTLTLFSGTNDVRQWRPWGAQARVIVRSTLCSPCHRTHCPIADHPCLNGLSPELVLSEALDMLQINQAATDVDAASPPTEDDGYPRFPASMYRRVRAERPSRGERLLNAGVHRARPRRPRTARGEARLTQTQTTLLAAWSIAVSAYYIWRVVLGGSPLIAAPFGATGTSSAPSSTIDSTDGDGEPLTSALLYRPFSTRLANPTRGDG